ncbi:hypothetical protein DFJ75_4041 [Williamsia muralis]|uniref:4-amino-4-deoxy-L-arabinose transferase-like glycosyltransferase n=1 Tax=Williamsia marianensis TaxID=85044 RepID=A0A495K799_WILMA|nr:DUF6541 family protein [Williamsia muralis]RKR97176.1 hypothetical protein DFJ75_4041 [Williamsia muralis]
MLLAAWITVVTAVILIVPGALVGRRMSLPWPVAVAAGAPLTFGMIGIFTVLYGALSIPWNVGTAAVMVGVSWLVAWGWDLGTRRFVSLAPAVAAEVRPISRPTLLTVAAGVLLGALIIVLTSIRRLIGTTFFGLNNISQVWDALWHADALQWIHETGDGSSLHMGELMNYDTHGFNYYPNTWHDLGALLYPLTGANTVELYNIYSPASLAFTLPISIGSLAYWLGRKRFDPDRSAVFAALAAAVTAVFPSLPYVELAFTAVPNAVGVSLAPVTAVLVISAVGDRRRVLAAVLAIAGTAATHPSGLVVMAVIVGSWWLLQALWKPVRGRGGDVATLAVIGAGALVLISPVIIGTLKISENNELSGFDFRDENASVPKAFVRAAFNGTDLLGHQYPLLYLLIPAAIGLGWLLWSRNWAVVAAWLAFIVTTANAVYDLGGLPSKLFGALGGYFYNSPHRLTFVVSMFTAVAAGIGLGVLVLGVARLLARKPVWQRNRLALPALTLVGLLIIAGAGAIRYADNGKIAVQYRSGAYVGVEDVEAYRWLAQQPEARSTVILNNLDQGSGWMYPVADLTPLFPFYRANDFSQRQSDVYWNVARIGADPRIDQIVRDLDIRYVIDAPPSYWWFQNGAPNLAEGRFGDPFLPLRENGAPGLREVYRQGNVTIYEVADAIRKGEK